MESTAVGNTTNRLNYTNGGADSESIDVLKGKKGGKWASPVTGESGGCMRCGGPSHRWRQCPFPFRKDSPFPNMRPAKPPKGAKKKGGYGTFLQEESPAEGQVEPSTPPEVDDTPLVGNPILAVDDNMSYQYYDYNSYVGSWSNEYLWTRSLATCFTVFDSIAGIIIDSGSTSSVCGLPWIKR